jgi:PAS domain S-box-containing protein
MPQSPSLAVHDPITRLRWTALTCGAGWLSAGIALATCDVSWIKLSLMTVAVPVSLGVLVLLIYGARAFKSSADVLETKPVMSDLPESERNLRLVLDRVPAFVHTITPTGELEFVNQTMLDFFGKTLDELKEWTGVVHPDDIAVVGSRLSVAFGSGQPFEVEARLLRADGTYRWFLERGLPLRDRNDHIVRWCHHLTDIDDKKRAEDALRTSERNLRLIVDSIPGAVIVQNPSGDIEFVNQQATQYFGVSIEQFKTYLSCGLVYEEDLPQFMEGQESAFAGGQAFEHEFRGRRADGSYRWIHQRTLPLKDSEDCVICWYGLLIDIHDQKMALDALRRTQAKLSRAAQIAAVAELSASIAHEINQPLAAVVTNGHACLSWLSADTPNVERAVLSAEKVIRNGNNAAQVVQRMRALFQHAPPSMDKLNMNEIVQEVCGFMRDEAQRKAVMLRTDLHPNLPDVVADRVQLQQLLSNLTRNAIEAMDSVTDRPKEISIKSAPDAQGVVVHVADLGMGISDSDSLFEPFISTKPKGMGMGLAICKSIVEAHDGRIWATSNEGAGATFSFSLPIMR